MHLHNGLLVMFGKKTVTENNKGLSFRRRCVTMQSLDKKPIH